MKIVLDIPCEIMELWIESALDEIDFDINHLSKEQRKALSLELIKIVTDEFQCNKLADMCIYFGDYCSEISKAVGK